MSESRWQSLGVIAATLLVVPGVFLASAPARTRSGLSVTLADVSPAGSSVTLRYHALIPAGERVEPSDYFRVSDVSGYLEGSAEAPEGWSVSVEKGHASGVDLTFRYERPEAITGPKLIKTFSAGTTSDHPRAIRRFVGRDTRASGVGLGSKIVSAGKVLGRGSVPEPTSMLSTTIGVMILGVVYAKRHRSKVQMAA